MATIPPSILLVEDDPDDVALFRRALKKVRPESDLSVARDGDEAIEILSRFGAPLPRDGSSLPSYVILDLKLPKRSGLEILDWIQHRRELRGLQVVMLTSSLQPADLERAHCAGLDRYYVKPPNFSDLVETVRRILAEWHLLS